MDVANTATWVSAIATAMMTRIGTALIASAFRWGRWIRSVRFVRRAPPRRRRRGPLRIDLQPERTADPVAGEQEVRRTEEIVGDRGIDAIPIGGDDAPGLPARSRRHPALAVEMPHRTRLTFVHEPSLRDGRDR